MQGDCQLVLTVSQPVGKPEPRHRLLLLRHGTVQKELSQKQHTVPFAYTKSRVFRLSRVEFVGCRDWPWRCVLTVIVRVQTWSTWACCCCCGKSGSVGQYTASREQQHHALFLHVEDHIESAQSEQIESLLIGKQDLSPYKIKWINTCGIKTCKSQSACPSIVNTILTEPDPLR